MKARDALVVLPQQSLPAAVQNEVERMILEERLKLGEALRVGALVSALSVLRGPQREAFRGLDEEGGCSPPTPGC
jgi:DNA-binding GntR family transcriptional regulator